MTLRPSYCHGNYLFGRDLLLLIKGGRDVSGRERCIVCGVDGVSLPLKGPLYRYHTTLRFRLSVSFPHHRFSRRYPLSLFFRTVEFGKGIRPLFLSRSGRSSPTPYQPPYSRSRSGGPRVGWTR